MDNTVNKNQLQLIERSVALSNIVLLLKALGKEEVELPRLLTNGIELSWLGGLNGNNLYMRGANFKGASLNNAQFNQADLLMADFTSASLVNAQLNEADLSDSILVQADCSNAQFRDATLNAANLEKAKLSNADLGTATLTRATLVKAIMVSAKLKGANLAYADLLAADLRGADLTDAILDGAYLENADLSNADLNGTRLPLRFFFHARTYEDAKNLEKAVFVGKENKVISGLEFNPVMGAFEFIPPQQSLGQAEAFANAAAGETIHLATYDPKVLEHFNLPENIIDAVRAYQETHGTPAAAPASGDEPTATSI